MGKLIKKYKKFDFKEFLQFKKRPPFSSFRQKSKAFNFGLIFGASPRTIAQTIIQPQWSLEESIAFAKQNNLFKDKKPKDMEPKEIFLLCAEYICRKFFEAYPGLKTRIEANRRYARQKGFIRSFHGAFRRLPLLRFPRGEDDYLYAKELSNMENIAVNSDIQNLETVIMHRALLKFQEIAKEKNIRATIFNVVHDAVELYVHKDDVELAFSTLKECMEQKYPEYKGIPISCEGEICDPSQGEIF